MAPELSVIVWCQGCGPEPSTRDGEVMEHRSCVYHAPILAGADDAGMRVGESITYDEAGGASNRAACAFFHRSRRP